MAMVIANQPLDAAIENAKKVYGALKANPRSLYLGRTFTVTLNSQEQAKFTDLLIDLGVLIFQSQKMPEQGKIKVLTGMVQLIASKVEPDRTEQFEKSMHLALKAVPFVWQLAECEKSQQIQQIQNVVMNLVLTKEWFSFNKYYSSLHNELIRCEEIRKKFWTLLPQSLGRKNFWALSKDSPLTEICRNSRHVFILFVKYGNYLKQGLRSQDPNYSQFTEPLEKRLSHCDPSERMVIEVFLAQFKASKAAEAYNRIQGKWKGFFTNTMKHLIEDQFFRTMIPEFAPEFKSGVIKVNTYLKSYNDAFAEDKEVLDVNAGITALLTQECSLFSQVIDEKNFIYSFFYAIFEKTKGALTEEARRAFEESRTCTKNLDLSIVCRDKQRVLTPQEFTEMTPEGVGALIHRSSKSVRDGGRQNSLQIESSQCNTVVPVPVKLKKKKKPPRAHLVSTDRKEHAPPQHKTPLVDVPSPAAAVMPDKSKVLELGPAAAIVSKNPTFKDIIAQSKCPIETYDTRVTRWFENPKVALAKADPTGKKDHDRLLRVHTFPLFLDYLIGTRYCITDECTNAVGKKSDLFCLIGELVNLKTNKADTGVLSIAVDEDHVCWHRAWAWMTTNNILNGIISGFLNKITNPTPAEANTRDKGMARSAMTKMDDIPVILDGADIITIPIDETHTLRLFPCDI